MPSERKTPPTMRRMIKVERGAVSGGLNRKSMSRCSCFMPVSTTDLAIGSLRYDKCLAWLGRVAARREAHQHLLHRGPDRQLVDPRWIDLRLRHPVPHLLGRRPVERIDYDLTRCNRLVLAPVGAARGCQWLVLLDGSGRKANQEVRRWACLHVALVRKGRCNQVADATLHFERSGRHFVGEGRRSRKTEPEGAVRCKRGTFRTDRLNVRGPRRGRRLASCHGNCKCDSHRFHDSPLLIWVECSLRVQRCGPTVSDAPTVVSRRANRQSMF